MPGGNESRFFSNSFAFTKIEMFKKTYFSNRKQKACAVTFFLVIILIILSLLKLTSQSKIQSRKSKRDLPTNEDDEIQITESNIEILPENRRMNHYPNHRYVEDQLYKNAATGLVSKPEELKTAKYLSNIQDIIIKEKLRSQKGNGQNKFLIELLKRLGSSMRLKGVYILPGSKESFAGNHLGEKFYYSKEINNLMQSDSGEKEGKRHIKNAFKNLGAPFKLSGKGRDVSKRNRPNQENFHLNHNLESQPITIFLDFHPIEEHQRKKSNFESYNTASSDSKLYTSTPRKLLHDGKLPPPVGKQNGIIMKINLHPKNATYFRRNFEKLHGSKSHSKYNKKAERKSFGSFFKHKKKNNGKECSSIMGLNPRGKHITAKWKNENGEWIHAKHVTVKHLKKEND